MSYKKGILVGFLLAIVSQIFTQSERPNILWINCDDLGQELGCYGNPDVSTPAIDKLANKGIRYTKVYANTSVCSSSRSSLLTGMYPVSINCQDHRTINKADLPEGIVPITEYFKNAGYFCSNGNGLDMSRQGKKDFNFRRADNFDGTDWAQRANGQPFFAQVQIKYPHRPFKKDTLNPVNPDSVTLPGIYPNHPLLRADWALYLESVQHCDRIVEEILKRIEDEGLKDNTIIFFFGDNGRPHLRDKQFLYEGGVKIPLIIYNPFDNGITTLDANLVSLVDVAATSLSQAGIKVPGYMHGHVFLGKKEEKRKYVFGFRQRAGDAVENMRSINDGRYKLIWNRMPQIPWMQVSGYKKNQYPAFSLYKVLHKNEKLEAPYNLFMADSKPELELYDLKTDPNEFNNLAGNSAYEKIQIELFKILKKNLAEFEKDMIEESQESIQKAKESSYQYYLKQMQYKNLDPKASDEDILKYWEDLLLDTNK